MKYLLVLSVIIIFGCKGGHQEQKVIKVKTEDINLVRQPSVDSVVYPLGYIKPDSHRYFLISYSTRLVKSKELVNNNIEGNMALGADQFPNKNDIDSMVFKLLLFKRKCYQNIIITSIFEFKNKQDFDSYCDGVKGAKSIKHKKECQ